MRYRLVDYSAPAVHAHKKVTVKGYVDRVEIALGAEIVARHRRSYVRGDVVYDPLHYLSLLEKKPGALDQAAPLRGWKLDPAFDTLRRLLEARFGPRGKREYIRVLRLHEDFPERQVAAAVRDAVKRRLIGFDAVKHLLLARIERRPVHLDLSRYPHLPRPFVAATRSADYAKLPPSPWYIFAPPPRYIFPPPLTLLWNGSIGSTTGGSWSPSETSRRPKPRNATTPCSSSQTWRRDSNKMASDKPGAVQPDGTFTTNTVDEMP